MYVFCIGKHVTQESLSWRLIGVDPDALRRFLPRQATVLMSRGRRGDRDWTTLIQMRKATARLSHHEGPEGGGVMLPKMPQGE